MGRPQGFVERQVRNWRKRWESAKVEELPLMDELGQWLATHVPTSPPPTLLHNDYKLDNLMVDPTDITRIIALFDWDQCTLGDPLIDLGLLLNYWTQHDDPAGPAGDCPNARFTGVPVPRRNRPTLCSAERP